MGRFGFPRLSEGALSHIKYPIVVDNRRFREATGFQYENDEGRIIRIFREASPPPGS
jgi:UDP-glucose 4-epimerase